MTTQCDYFNANVAKIGTLNSMLFEVGTFVVVNPDSPLPLALFLNKEVLEKDLIDWLYPDETLQVTGGPHYERSMAFFQVESLLRPIKGWASEGLDGERFIVPLQSCRFCARSLSSQIRVGIQARVVGKEYPPLPMWNTPGTTTGSYLCSLFSDEVVSVLEGPHYVWTHRYCTPFWKVKKKDETVGWVAERDCDNYWLEPLPAIDDRHTVYA